MKCIIYKLIRLISGIYIYIYIYSSLHTVRDMVKQHLILNIVILSITGIVFSLAFDISEFLTDGKLIGKYILRMGLKCRSFVSNFDAETLM